jgi:hypothetical protein
MIASGKCPASEGLRPLENLKALQQGHPAIIRTVRGKGLLLAMEIEEPQIAAEILDKSLGLGLFVNLTQGNVIRVFPALNIRKEEAAEGLELLKKALTAAVQGRSKATEKKSFLSDRFSPIERPLVNRVSPFPLQGVTGTGTLQLTKRRLCSILRASVDRRLLMFTIVEQRVKGQGDIR